MNNINIKKTIFIPVSGRQQVRNVLRTDVASVINKKDDTLLVFFAPQHKIETYQNEFKVSNIIFEGIPEAPRFFSKSDIFFGRLASSFINSLEARSLRKEWLLHDRNQKIRYLVSSSLLMLFGNVRSLRKITRSLDYHIVRDERFASFFDKYRPNLVFTPRIDLPLDRSFLRHAKKRNITTVGMINSWDNITYSKFPFRILPDTLIVHNKFMKEDSIKYLDMKADDVFISGLSHFDHYITNKCSPKDVFYKKIGVDPSKKIILCSSNAGGSPNEWQILSMLDDAVKNGALPNDIVFLARHHPSKNMFIGDLKPSPHIVFDESKSYVKKGVTYTEIFKDDMQHLADSVFYSSVTINHGSTMSVDAAVFDKPIINPVFDGWEEKPFYESVRRYYVPSHIHYYRVVESGGVKLAYSIEELISDINSYLENPSLDKEGRKRIVKEQCYKLDGKSGERVGEIIVSKLNK